MCELILVPIMCALPLFAVFYSRSVMKKSEKLVWKK